MLVDRDATATARLLDRARAAGAEPALWAFNKTYFLDGPLGRYDAALDTLAEAEVLQRLRPLTLEALSICGRVFIACGDLARARAVDTELRSATLRLYSTGSPYVLFAIAEATGDREAAAAALEELLRQSPDSRPVQLWLVGQGCKVLGEYERALLYWTRAVDRHEVYALTRLPMVNRNDPRFLALIERMGLAGGSGGK